MPVQFSFDVQDLERVIGALMRGSIATEAEVRKGVAVITNAVHAGAIKRVKVRSGKTRQGIQKNVSGLTGWVGPTTVPGIILETGSSPHVITATNAQALMIPVHPDAAGRSSQGGSPFGGTYGRQGTLTLSGRPRAGPFGRAQGGAQVSFFKSVHHPGTQPQPYLRPAMEEATPMIEAELLRMGAAVLGAMRD